MRPKTTPLKHKIILPVAVVSLLVATVVSSFIAVQQRQSIMAKNALQMAQIHASIERNLADRMSELRNAIVTLTYTPAVDRLARAEFNGGADPLDGLGSDALKQRLQLIYTIVAALDKSYYRIQVVSSADNGKVLVSILRPSGSVTVAQEAELQEIGSETYFQQANRLSRDQIYFSDVRLNRVDGEIESPQRPILHVAMPIFVNDVELFGIVDIDVDLTSLFEELSASFSEQFQNAGIGFYITNSDGDYLLHPDASKSFAFESGSTSRHQDEFQNPTPVLSGYGADGLLSDDALFVDMQRANSPTGTVYTMTRQVSLNPDGPGPQLSFTSAIPVSIIDQSIFTALWRVYLIAFAMGLLTLLVLWWILGKHLRPLSNLSLLAREVAEGNYRGELPTSSVTEISTVIDSLNSLRESVADRESNLRNSEHFANEIIDSAPQGISLINEHGAILRVNSRMPELFHYTKEELLDRKFSDLVPGEENAFDLVRNNEELHADPTKVLESHNLLGRRKDGSEFAVDLALAPIQIDGKSEVLITVIDMTEYRALEQELISHRDQLEFKVKQRTEKLIASRNQANRLLKARSEFLANMSHEIRTPMTAILGLLDVLRHTEMTPNQQKYVFQIHNSSRALLHIINDVLDISKIEAGKIDLEMREYSLVDAVESTIDLFAPSADLKAISLHLKIDPGITNQVVGDRTRLTQILNNLLGNAIKFTDRGEVLLSVDRLDVAKESMNIRFTVSDTGIGISEEALKRLVQPFEQADSATTRLFGGTGLGLSISNKLIQLMGGKLNIQSTPGKGSQFQFDLPLTLSAKAEKSLAHPPRLGKRVLVVDDQPINCEIIGDMMHHWDCRVISAFNGQQALEKLLESSAQKKPFDFMIIDWRMPVMNGFGLIKSMEALYSQQKLDAIPPVLMVTEAERVELVQSEDYRDDVTVLVKPITVSRLLSTLSDLGLIPMIRAHSEDLSSRLNLGIKLKDALNALPAPPRLLLVEDNDTNQIVIKELLREFRLDIEVAGNGKQAVERVSKEPFDLVLMDLQMPIMDGFEATRRIRKLNSAADLPILALSAATFVDDIHKSGLAGMNEHLNKPIDVEHLLNALLRWLPLGSPQVASTTTTEAISATSQPEVRDSMPVSPDKIGQLQTDPEFDLTNTLYTYAGKLAYLRLLEAFVGEFGELLQKWRENLPWDKEEKCRFAHSIKGSAGSIGATSLALFASRVEQEMRSNDESKLPELVNRLERVLEKIGT